MARVWSWFTGAALRAEVVGGPWIAGGHVFFLERGAAGDAPRLIGVPVDQPFGRRSGVRLEAGDGAVLSVVDIPGLGMGVATALPAGEGRVRSMSLAGAGLDWRLDEPVELSGWKPAPAAVAVVAARKPPLQLTSVVKAESSTGRLFCLNVGESRLAVVRDTARGPIDRVRFRDTNGVVLGEAAVEDDGSFFVEVPADLPLQLELLRGEKVVGRDHSGLWVRPNESRGCVGCHEDPDLAPENATVRAFDRDPDRIAGETQTASAGAVTGGAGRAR